MSQPFFASAPARRFTLPLAASTLLVTSVVATADTIAILPNVTTGTQNFNTLFGIDFNVNTPISVTQLGVFDNAGDGVLNTNDPVTPIVIQIWNRDTGVALAALNFGGGTGDGTQTTLAQAKFFLSRSASL